MKRGVVAAIAAALVAASILGPSATASPHHKPVCNRHRHQSKLTTAKVLVWSKRGPTPAGPGTVYFACIRPRGKSIKLGVTEPSGEYLSDLTLGGFEAGGTFVGGQGSAGAGQQESCYKYYPQDACPPPNYYLRVVDIKTNRRADLATDPSAPFVLSPKGAVAWLNLGAPGMADLWATPLHPSGKTFTTSPTQLDSGNIDPASLKFSGDTLSWTDNGTPHQQVIQ